MAKNIDQTDRTLIRALQMHPEMSQREIADHVGMSQNACWRRLKQLENRGVIRGKQLLVDRRALGLDLVVFTMIRTRTHSADWLQKFRAHVSSIPDVVDFFRIGGEYDYMLKIVTADMESFDRVYQRLIEKIELDAVTSLFAMEAIAENRPLPV